MKEWKYVVSSKHKYDTGKVVETKVIQECDLSELTDTIWEFIHNHENVKYDSPLTIIGEKKGTTYVLKCGYSNEDF